MRAATLDVRTAVLDAVRRGWPVVPATYPDAEGNWQGREGATGLRPLADDWFDHSITDRESAFTTWEQQPYGLLLVCGHGVDVLDVPVTYSELLAEAELSRIPLATTAPPERLLLFTKTGSDHLVRELATRGMALRGLGCWAPLPPTAIMPACPVRWLEPLRAYGAQTFPSAERVQQSLIVALSRSQSALREGDRDDGG